MKCFNQIVALAALLTLPFLASIAGAEDAPPSPAASAEADDKYSAEELEDIVGPIALYPDIVISSLLPASTVPLDVVSAARWVGEQTGEIAEAPEDKGWDDSVRAMVQFPDTLAWMSENLDWLEELGYAVSVQQEDVLAAIQDFRAKTQEGGNLESNDKQVVTEEDDSIYIEPADPQIVYVPQYNPVQVVTQPSYRYSFWSGVAVGVVGAWAFNTIRWGGGWGRGRGSINVNKTAQFNFTNNGNINRGGAGGARWGATPRRGAGGRPATRPNAGRSPARPRSPGYSNRSKNRAVKGGGMKPGKASRRSTPGRPGGTRPGGSRTGGSRAGGTRPAPGATGNKRATPGRSGGTRSGGSRTGGTRSGGTRSGGTRSGGSKPKSSGSAFSGSSRSGSSARKSSQRGRSSRSSSSRSSGSRSSGGRSRGGGGRGGGGRRR